MKKNRLHVAIAACSFQLPKLEDGSAWIQVTPAGEFWPMDGRPMDVPGWRIDAASAAAVIERARSRKTPPVLDYEHQTLKKSRTASPRPLPAVSWTSNGAKAPACGGVSNTPPAPRS
ncbi:phage protease [Pseudomonas aeruginosa]